MQDYWNLVQHPFLDHGDDLFFYPADLHIQTMNRLRYLADNGTMRFGLLTGDAGVGKSAMLAQICAHCAADRKYIPACFPHGMLAPRDLMADLVRRFDRQAASERFISAAWHESVGTQLSVFADLMRSKVLRLDRHLVVCIDEAQHMDSELLSVCKLMSDIGASGENGITFLLAAPPEGCERLVTGPELDTRLALRCDIPPFTADETGAYIDARMQHAGYRGVTLFDASARRAIHDYSGGIPREINRLATMALERGEVFKDRFISSDTVHGAIESVLGRQLSA